jgi:DNA-binding CsgD family transcriptional regulator
METLSQQDLSSLRRFLQEAVVPGDPAAFATRLLPLMARLVPGDVVCFAQVDPVKQKLVTQITYASGGEAQNRSDVFERYMLTHPVFEHWGKTGQSEAARTSAFVSREEWHTYPLYQEYYKHWRCEDSLAIGLPAPAGLIACFCIERAQNFTDRELLLIETVRPYLANIYRTAEAFSLIGQAGNGHGNDWVLLDGQGGPIVASSRALQLIARHFPGESQREHILPDRLIWWVRRQLKRFTLDEELPPLDDPFVQTTADGGTLTIRLVCGPTTGEQAVLLLRESRVANGNQIHLDDMLTAREIEVLTQARQGFTAAEIADALYISRRTVEKHLEHIYNKLGVDSRIEAVTRAFLS